MGRSQTCARRGDGLAHLVQVAEGLDDDQVDAGVRQGRDLLGEGRREPPRAGRARKAPGAPPAGRHPRRRALAGMQIGPRRAGKLHTGAVDLGHLIIQAVGSQLEAVGAEGIGLDDLGAGFEIIAVNLLRPDPARSGSGRRSTASKPAPRALSSVPMAPSPSSGRREDSSKARKRLVRMSAIQAYLYQLLTRMDRIGGR